MEAEDRNGYNCTACERLRNTYLVVEFGRTFFNKRISWMQTTMEKLEGDHYTSYREPEPISTQRARVQGFFHAIGRRDVLLPSYETNSKMEGNFAIPRWGLVAPTYAEAVACALRRLALSVDRNFRNMCVNELQPERLRQSERTKAMLDLCIEKQKPHEVLIIPGQFGSFYKRRTVHEVRQHMQLNEFGLGAFAVCIMLMTHPQRLAHEDDLWIDCPGDEYDLDGDGRFDHVPYFKKSNDKLVFGMRWIHQSNPNRGAATAFVT